jgi:CRISPR system Cascade subunit CasD
MRWLLIDLLAPMASFGGNAPGSVRDTELIPSRGALLGLVAAALGIRREEADVHAALGRALRFAVRVEGDCPLLRDYHTAQAPKESAMKGRPRMTRRDELAVPKDGLNAVLSDRYYHCDFHATVGVVSEDAQYAAERLAQALTTPLFTLYLGRKSCPLHWPLDPQIEEADSWQGALALRDAHQDERAQQWRKRPSMQALPFRARSDFGTVRSVQRFAWDSALAFGQTLPNEREVVRRDDPIDRTRWLFAERRHHRAEVGIGGPP